MDEHNHDAAPVHVRTVHDQENGQSYVVIGVEVDGTFHGFHTFTLEAFNENLQNLKQAAS